MLWPPYYMLWPPYYVLWPPYYVLWPPMPMACRDLYWAVNSHFKGHLPPVPYSRKLENYCIYFAYASAKPSPSVEMEYIM